MTQPLVELYGDCMVVLKVSRCCIDGDQLRAGEVPAAEPGGAQRHRRADAEVQAGPNGDGKLRGGCVRLHGNARDCAWRNPILLERPIR